MHPSTRQHSRLGPLGTWMCCLGSLGGQARVEVGTGPGRSRLDELSLESREDAFMRTGPLRPAWGGGEALLLFGR